VSDGVTVGQAMDIARDTEPVELVGDDRQYLVDLRRITFDQLAVYERRLGLSPTTSEKLLWLKKRGPKDETILHQLANIELNRA